MITNAGVPQGSVLSATLFLLHINDLLLPGIYGYADDSTVVERYLPSTQASKELIRSEREAMVERTNDSLQAVSEWGEANLVGFNATKTQARLFTAKRSPFTLAPAFRNVSLECADRLQLLGVEISSDLNFGRFIESKAKIAARKLGVLAKVRQYFTPGQLLMLYKAQVRSCVEYCSHIWAGAAKCHLAALDSVEGRAKRLIGDPDLANSNLQSLQHRRRVASLSVFYRMHFGECAQELHELIPPSRFHHRTSRRTAGIHPYVVQTSTVRTKRFASSFIPRISRDWNNLPAAVFPSDYDLGVFKARVNRFLIN
ncbi:hypothetical protein PYW07_004145 [Mythimna separata]|uniref:Reverse transcriptase domain-containing protein n=1 Tax=Mythimna separata TaxID=271217 RepID=A0AAD7YQY9_MYTSE|nr:hypothetical protein PYW07_004145 [Mythimna separata]